MYFVYFLKSTKNNKIYVGCTKRLVKERLYEHNIGSNNWTKLNNPFILIYFEKYYCQKDAYEREKFYKHGFGRTIRDIIISSVSAIGR